MSNIDFEADASLKQMPQEKLESLGVMANRAVDLEDEIEKLEQAVSKMKEEHRKLIEVEMPSIMLEIGLSEVKTTTGRKLSMTTFYSASIPAETEADAFAWLRENNFDSIIKNKIEATFGKGEDERVQKLMEQLVDEGFTCKTNVHPMTLKSFVKEQIESGTPLPPAIKVHVGQRIKIK
jgi:polyhydroxyalkanoate synthesis regulator phasin